MITSLTTAQGYIDEGNPVKIVGDPVFYEPLAVAVDKSAEPTTGSLAEAVDDIVGGDARRRHADRAVGEVVRRGPDDPAVTRVDGRCTPGRMTTWERVALALARIPFRLKVAAVWVVIFLVLGFFCIAAGFDWSGCRTTSGSSSTGSVHDRHGDRRHRAGDHPGLLGALARLSRNPVAYGVSGFYISFFRGTPLIVQMFLIYLALPPVGRTSPRYSWLPEGFDQALSWSRTRAPRARAQLRRLHDRDLPGRHPVGRRGQGEAADALGMKYGQKMRRWSCRRRSG